MPPESFTSLVPLLRRTFSTFSAPERREMAERVSSGKRQSVDADDAGFDYETAAAVLPLVDLLLGRAKSVWVESQNA